MVREKIAFFYFCSVVVNTDVNTRSPFFIVYHPHSKVLLTPSNITKNAGCQQS